MAKDYFSDDPNEVISKNQGLVRRIVKQFSPSPNDFDDFVSIGNIGLLKASYSFDKSKGIQFATYSSQCIMNEIRMYLRKQKRYANDISLDEPLSLDKDGNELLLQEILPNSEKEFTEEVAKREISVKLISIVLNVLSPRDRLMMLYKIAGCGQRFVGESLNISQSYVSRIYTNLIKKMESYLTKQQKYKEVFSMAIVDNLYRISFSSKDIQNFKEIFATFLQDSHSDSLLPDFKVSCNKERIVIHLPADPESFYFIAKLIKEIDEFNMTFVSDKSLNSESSSPKDAEVVTIEEVSAHAEQPKTNLVPTKNSTDSTSDNLAGNSKKENYSKQLRTFFASVESFTIKELKEHFPLIPATTITQIIYGAKKEGLIESVSRGKYVCSTNKNQNT